MRNRELDLVELVTDDGQAIGSATVERAHLSPGLAHRAFSVMLVDPAGRVLLQRRSAAKTRFALRWANACCGHPAPGEDVVAAGAGRLTAELGLTAVRLTEAGVYSYRAEDPAVGRVEHEFDHVLAGHLDDGHEMAPDPGEVDDIRWLAPDRLATELTARPAEYAPWLGGVFAVWRSAAGS